MEAYKNVEVRFNIIKTKGKHDLHGSQTSFLEKLKKVFKTKKLKEELKLIKEIIRRNKPEYTEQQILELAKEISSSGCTYVAAANNIFEQINYDEDRFYAMFKFPMRMSDGSLNHDALIAELYSFMKDKVEVDVRGKYRTFTYDNVLDAAKNLLGKEFKTSQEAFVALTSAGYSIDGSSYTKFFKEPEVFMGDYQEIARKLLGINVNSVEEFKRELNNQKITAFINDFFNPLKLSGLNVTTFDKWMNYYFQEKNIDLIFSSECLYSENYEMLIEQLKSVVQAGASISVGTKQGANLAMTDGSKLGWFNFSDLARGGHAMPFVGISNKGDIIVSSWGEKQMIPKEFYDRMHFYVRKLKSRDKKYEEVQPQEKVEEIDWDKQIYKNIIESINRKIHDLNKKKNNLVQFQNSINDIFTSDELAFINFESILIKDVKGNEIPAILMIVVNGEELSYRLLINDGIFSLLSKNFIEDMIAQGRIIANGNIQGINQLNI